MRTVYLGTSEFAVAVLHRLARSGHSPSLVVTRPDRPRGRGRRLASPPVAEAAHELGIAVYQPESVNAPPSIERIGADRPQAVCVCAFGALITEPLLSLHPMVNVHPSLLPKWRGAAPIERAIMAGDERTGVSTMAVSAGLDSGPVYLQSDERVESEDTFGTLSPRLAALGGELLVQTLDEWPEPLPQDDAAATYAEKITPDDRRLDPSRPAAELERVVRALEPHIGAFVDVDGDSRLGVRRARVTQNPGLVPGKIAWYPPRPVLGCAADALELIIVQPPGRRAMPAEDYLRGRRT